MEAAAGSVQAHSRLMEAGSASASILACKQPLYQSLIFTYTYTLPKP